MKPNRLDNKAGVPQLETTEIPLAPPEPARETIPVKRWRALPFPGFDRFVQRLRAAAIAKCHQIFLEKVVNGDRKPEDPKWAATDSEVTRRDGPAKTN